MATLTLELEDGLVRRMEELARREHKSLSEWVAERVITGLDRADTLADMEARAVANGYPPGWLALFGSLADDEHFDTPARSKARVVPNLNGD